jgi:proline iminopeptidase
MSWDDPEECGHVPVEGGRIWYRLDGVDRPGTPIIAIAGGPGLSHHYLAPLLALSDERPVVLYDQLDTGNADRPGDPANWTLARFVTEIPALRRALGLDEVVLLGDSWGSMVAVVHALSRPVGLRGLVLAGPVISARRFRQDGAALVAELPEPFRAAITDCTARGDFDNVAYRQAEREFLRRHVLPAGEKPVELSRSLELLNDRLYHFMWGPSEFAFTGALADFEAAERLPELDLPVLLTCGEHDEARPATCGEFAAMIPDARLVVISEAGHCSLSQKPAEYVAELRRFLARVDTVAEVASSP